MNSLHNKLFTAALINLKYCIKCEKPIDCQECPILPGCVRIVRKATDFIVKQSKTSTEIEED